MHCIHCGAELPESAKFCTSCGARVVDCNSIYSKKSDTETEQQYNYLYGIQLRDNIYDYKYKDDQDEMTEDDIPEKFSPLRPWTYFWLRILFSLPIVGLIFLIIFSIDDSNINRCYYARSYWCVYIIIAIVAIVLLLLSFFFSALL